MRRAARLAALTGTALTAACGGADEGNVAEPPEGLVVYPAIKGEERALVVESLDGRVRNAHRYSVTSFATSPSGEAIAFATRRQERTEIFVLRTESGAVEPLGLADDLVGEVFGLVWSPSGKSLAFAVHEPTGPCGPDRADQVRLHTVRADGTDLRSLPWYPPGAAPLKDNPTGVSVASWSPDERRLLYQVSQGSECEVRGSYLRASPLAVVNVAGGAPVTIARNYLPGAAVWSPVGERVAVTTENEASAAVEIFDLRTGERRVLRKFAGEVEWTRAGIYTTLSTDELERSRVVRLDPDTGETTPVTTAAYPSLVATSSGSHVAVLEPRLAADYTVTYRMRVFARNGTLLLTRKLSGDRRGGFKPDETTGTVEVVLTSRDE